MAEPDLVALREQCIEAAAVAIANQPVNQPRLQAIFAVDAILPLVAENSFRREQAIDVSTKEGYKQGVREGRASAFAEVLEAIDNWCDPSWLETQALVAEIKGLGELGRCRDS